jgi:hypothetical protein
MKLMGHWNWWAPAPLVRLWEWAGLSDLEGEGEGHQTSGPPVHIPDDATTGPGDGDGDGDRGARP